MYEQSTNDVIIGIHGIFWALKNTSRANKNLYATKEGLEELKKVYKISNKILEDLNVEVHIYSTHLFQENAKKIFKEQDLKYMRVPSGVLLTASSLKLRSENWIIDQIRSGKKGIKIFCLDQVTDIHNSGAITRTAAFYGVDALVIASKGSFGTPPAYFRLAAGAAEIIPLIQSRNLSKFLRRLQEEGVTCIGLSEEKKGEISPTDSYLLV